jgi:type IV pilus assembly protein PilV
MQLKSGSPAVAGFMLVEVLVAMLLASLAVVAVAHTHAAALQLTRTGQHRVQAAQLATDLAERLRAHPAGALGAWGEGGASPYQLSQSWAAQQTDSADTLAMACDGPGATCTPQAFAQADAAQWRQQLRHSLPGGAAQVDVDANLALADVWVAWRDAQPLRADETPLAPAECPAGLGLSPGSGVRCVHLRLAW